MKRRVGSIVGGIAFLLSVGLTVGSMIPERAIAAREETAQFQGTELGHSHNEHGPEIALAGGVDAPSASVTSSAATAEVVTPAPLGAPLPAAERVQFVLVSMDATPRGDDVETNFFHRFHERVSGTGDATYTVFINTGFLQLDPRSSAPRRSEWAENTDAWNRLLGALPLNRPSIRYSEDPEAATNRVRNIRALHRRGVEIGSHGVRHEDGRDWSEAQWRAEFADHQRILDLHNLPTPVGIRAPFLGTSEGYWAALEAQGMRYDTSRVGGAHRTWPETIEGTNAYEVKVPSVLVNGRGTIFFDLNLKNNLEVTNSEYYQIAMNEFEARYEGGRAPFLMSGHGNYSNPIARVMNTVCDRPLVRCGTFEELVEYMDAHPELEGI